MRVVREIPHPSCKITLFSWNNRYIIKLEMGFFEQTFKVDQSDIFREEDLNMLVNEKFIAGCLRRFEEMHHDLLDSLQDIR